MTDTSIHILLAFDDNFWAPAYAAMRGISLSTHRRADLVFHLCETGLTPDHRNDLERITEEFGATLVFYDLAQNEVFLTRCATLPSDKRLNQMMYARLMVDALIAPEIKRIIYFDCDTYVRSPIEELAEIDLNGFPIGAVEEPHADFITRQTDMRHNADLFDPADPYFNSGMLVIDTAKWRKIKVLDHLAEMVENGTMDRIYYDQDFLNLVFKDNWFHIDQMWNLVDPRAPHQALNPKMVHYTGRNRPWNLISNVAFARTYRHVMTNELFYRYMRHRWTMRIKKLLHLS